MLQHAFVPFEYMELQYPLLLLLDQILVHKQTADALNQLATGCYVLQYFLVELLRFYFFALIHRFCLQALIDHVDRWTAFCFPRRAVRKPVAALLCLILCGQRFPASPVLVVLPIHHADA